MEPISRRDLFASALSAGILPLLGAEKGGEARKLKVIAAGGHPDDPESGAGGTLARAADLGHEAVALYLTRGEGGIAGKSHAEAAAIRTAEAEKACSILKARARFVGQIDGATEVNAARYDEVRKIIEEERPDIVLTHWPVDSHRDHRAMSLLIYDAWLNLGKRFALYYFEVNAGSQTQHFRPTHYVDITLTADRKKAACYAHVSQDPPAFYDRYHEPMQRFRGLEATVAQAEGFARHVQSHGDWLP